MSQDIKVVFSHSLAWYHDQTGFTTEITSLRDRIVRATLAMSLSTLEATQGHISCQSSTCNPILVAFVLELTKEIIHLPMGCLQGGIPTPI